MQQNWNFLIVFVGGGGVGGYSFLNWSDGTFCFFNAPVNCIDVLTIEPGVVMILHQIIALW